MIEAYLRHMKTARTRPEAARMLKSQAVRRKKSVSRDRRVWNMRNFNLTSSCQICHQQDFFLGHHVYYLEYEEFSLDDLAKICPQHDVFRICPLVDVYNISYYI